MTVPFSLSTPLIWTSPNGFSSRTAFRSSSKSGKWLYRKRAFASAAIASLRRESMFSFSWATRCRSVAVASSRAAGSTAIDAMYAEKASLNVGNSRRSLPA